MKQLIIYIALALPAFAMAQSQFNIQKSYVAEGYDVVAYFGNKAVKGKKHLQATHQGVKYLFVNAENKAAFEANPDQYVPQYGGYCAYAMGTSGDKVSIDPETFEIRDGKLYLFYNAFFTNTLEKWLDENPNQLKRQADANWSKLYP